MWEWCRNEYENPENIQDGGSAIRVVRGGSWLYGSVDASARRRGWNVPSHRGFNRGCRVVLCVGPSLFLSSAL
ncbi:MAG: SUMF1/EgtB/PvdO family nonheme iron enzyme [Caldilineaceae bacterium]|nr:SUMF1/EgtB/PvdO family nonheme iron enzyme [Caldilineaceae bacterium]